jgi:hypothetical protein
MSCPTPPIFDNFFSVNVVDQQITDRDQSGDRIKQDRSQIPLGNIRYFVVSINVDRMFTARQQSTVLLCLIFKYPTQRYGGNLFLHANNPVARRTGINLFQILSNCLACHYFCCKIAAVILTIPKNQPT